MLKNQERNDIFVLQEKIQNAKDTKIFKFKPINKKILHFIPGQYVTLYFLEDEFGWQGKSYSIMSSPSDDFWEITVKKNGQFSEKIHNLKIGDKVKIMGPEGYFYPNSKIEKLVFLAGGVGITPFYSIIKNEISNKLDKKVITLFYGNKTKKDIVFLDELKKMSKNNKKLKIIHCISRELKNYGREYERGRISIKIIKKYIKNFSENQYFICGSISFVNELWHTLKRDGIQEKNIFTEAFY